jgi:hypothetical protein
MGNQNSLILGSPSEELKFKTGVKADPVPSPAGSKASTFEKLTSSPDFKNYLLSHLHSSYYVSSLINRGEDDTVLLQGIQQFQNLDPEHRASTMASLKQFQKMSSAGVCVSLFAHISI